MTGNLPPGVTPADIDRAYGSSVPSHDHEWVPESGGPSFMLEDGAAIFNYTCRFVEVTNTRHDPKRDEVYEETGAECDATESVRLETDANDAAVEAVEMAFHSRDGPPTDLVDYIDPPVPGRGPTDGKLVVSTDEHTVTYTRNP